jgi:zinc D-Ala-D-Ala carboxypeptidase
MHKNTQEMKNRLLILVLLSIGFLNIYWINNDNLTKKEYLLGLKIPADFVKVEKKYLALDKNILLLKPVYESFKEMYKDAENQGIKLSIVSGYRSWYHQKLIWEKKWAGKTLVEGKNLNDTLLTDYEKAKLILNYSAMPGTSRHHWGTEIDIISVEDSVFEKGVGFEAYLWLKDNASKYGFCQTYTPLDSLRPTGFREEKWHWSYFPISEKIINNYRENIKNSDISGFIGSHTADSLKVIDNYVLSINQECK